MVAAASSLCVCLFRSFSSLPKNRQLPLLLQKYFNRVHRVHRGFAVSTPFLPCCPRMSNCFEAGGQLRRDDHQVARLRLDQECRKREAHRLGQKDRERERKELPWRAATAPLLEALRAKSAESLAKILGPGEPGHRLASMLNDLNLNLSLGTWTSRTQSPPQSTAPIQPNQTESN